MLFDKLWWWISKPVSITATITSLPFNPSRSSSWALSTLVPGIESISGSRLCQFCFSVKDGSVDFINELEDI